MAELVSRSTLAVWVLPLLALGACSGPIETRAGLQGAGLPQSATVALAEVAGPLSDSARHAVASELERHGFTVSRLSASEAGTIRILVALAERPASLAVLGSDGAVVSPAKHRKLLQGCADRTQRLSLVAESPDGTVTRAWAEEYHCKATLAETLEPLAARAVALLAGDDPQGRPLRFGRD